MNLQIGLSLWYYIQLKNRFAQKQPKRINTPNPFPDYTTREKSKGNPRLSPNPFPDYTEGLHALIFGKDKGKN